MNIDDLKNEVDLNGLTSDMVEESRRRHGANVLTPPERTSLLKLYLEKYQDPIIRILLVAAAISLVLAFFENNFIETIGIFIAIFLATTIGFYFERDAAKKFSVLTAMDNDQPVKVRRNGKVTEIARRDVVVGDIILLEVGDEIPADARLLKAVDLQIDESSLTGEQITNKHVCRDGEAADTGEAFSADVVLRSSMVMNGRGTAVVTAVGDATEIGKVARKSTETTDTKTPLNIQLGKLAKLISKVGSVISIATFVIFLAHDILTNDAVWHGSDYLKMAEVVLKYFMMAVTLIVMAVPEGLPMAVTLSLALNMRRMLKSNNLVRKLHACETMGTVNVICTDKTGTLTQNRMTVADMSVCDNDAEAGNTLAEAIAVNTTAELDGDAGIGNPTEVALLRWLSGGGHDYKSLRDSADMVAQLPFSTERKYMATAAVCDAGAMLFVKGAPEIVLGMCGMEQAEREQVDNRLLGYQQKAMRTLAFAFRRLSTDELENIKENDGRLLSADNDTLTFQAVVAINDPIREDVPAAVDRCRAAGIEVKVVTGDTSATALEIARQIGVEGSSITGAEWSAMSDEEAYERAKDIVVMSRARPADKQRLVEMLQKHGDVVAVTGDGTNDAPALNYAHVGLSLGSGTSVAKEASDMTLLDDSFGSIAHAVMWGRSLYKNLQRFLYFQLVVNVTALLLVLAGSVIGTEMPLTVTQILWVNLIMDTFAALALSSLPPSREVMKEKPRKQTEFIITKGMWKGILFCGVAFFLLMFAMLIKCENDTDPGIQRHELTIFFTTFVMLQFWNLFNAKTLGSDYSAFRRIALDKGLILVFVLVLLGQWIIVTFGGQMFRTEPLSAGEWAVVIASTSVVLWAGEIWRLWKRWRK